MSSHKKRPQTATAPWQWGPTRAPRPIASWKFSVLVVSLLVRIFWFFSFSPRYSVNAAKRAGRVPSGSISGKRKQKTINPAPTYPAGKIVFFEKNLGRAYHVVDRVLGPDNCQNEGFLHIWRGRREFFSNVLHRVARARPCADFALGLKS